MSVSGQTHELFWSFSLSFPVNQLGLGTDMWLVPFDNITKILEVHNWYLQKMENFR